MECCDCQLNVGSKEAREVALIWETVRTMLEEEKGEAKVYSTIQEAFKNQSPTASEDLKTDLVSKSENVTLLEGLKAYPGLQSEREFFGGDCDLELGKWSSPSPTASSPPNLNSSEAEKMNLNTGHSSEPMEVEGAGAQSFASLHSAPVSAELLEALHKQETQMQTLLDQMERVDKDSPKRAAKEVYKKTHQSTVKSLRHVEQQDFGSADIGPSPSQDKAPASAPAAEDLEEKER